ncbi:hypothetical protein O6H91_02G036600 [Diphasiastrum complanatum]|uniref:Uncharacterized protein n=1 Tax=Diphasiastrum complanatum TaxID=34168 RepID=A0ACC2EEG3_DIPCM|nr:hypothetical protein O6H91_02G036600 [Diphasiastrum complanatum]
MGMEAGRQREALSRTLAKQMAAAGFAGMLADSIMYPMMTVKSRLMVQGAAVGSGNGAGSALFVYRGPLHAISSIAAQEGWRTLYKGYATVSQIAPAQALYMAAYQTAKRVLPGGHDNPLVHFTGGLVATLFQSLINVPVEVIRQRQMVQTGGKGAYKGSLNTVTTIYKQEGIVAFYRGFLLAQMVWGPYNATYFPLWEATKRLSVWYSGAESIEKLDLHWELASSFCSASFAAAITNPMDVIKTRLQVQGKSNVSNNTQYNGSADAARSIWRQEGWRGFTSGITSRMFWVAPSSMIMFTTFDQVMKRLSKT